MKTLKRFLCLALSSSILLPICAFAQDVEFLPPLNSQKLQFGTGQVKHNQPVISSILPDVGGNISPWYLAQWNQVSIITPKISKQELEPISGFGAPLYDYSSPDNHSSIFVAKSKSGKFAYGLDEEDGKLGSGGGANLFLSANTLYGGPNFLQPLEFSVKAGLPAAKISYFNNSAKKTGAVLGMAFVGFVIQFPAPDETHATSTLFLQISLANSKNLSHPLVKCSLDNEGALRILFGGNLSPKLPFKFSSTNSSLVNLHYNLLSYLEAVFSKPLVCQAKDHNLVIKSIQPLDLKETRVKNVYIGLETENEDQRPNAPMFGKTQGHVEVKMIISDPKLIQTHYSK